VSEYVLDTSALLAFTDGEDGADNVADLLRQGIEAQATLLVSFASWTEIYYVLLREQGRDKARAWIARLKELPLERVESNETMGLVAGEIKAAYHLSFADAWIAALSKDRHATLVHKDPEFEPLDGEIALLALPYK